MTKILKIRLSSHCKLLYNTRDNITRFIESEKGECKMRQLLKNKLKEQKGLTLIELLAVIVILGIIAAIAVPSILGLIENSKKDAHVANAQQVLNATKMAIASEASLQTGEIWLPLAALETKKYLDPIDSPTDPYEKGTYVTDTTMTADDFTISFVEINDGKVTTVHLITDEDESITATGTEVKSSDFTRSDVTK